MDDGWVPRTSKRHFDIQEKSLFFFAKYQASFLEVQKSYMCDQSVQSLREAGRTEYIYTGVQECSRQNFKKDFTKTSRRKCSAIEKQ